MFGFSEWYRFESDHDATRVSMSAVVEPRGLFRLVAPIMHAGIRLQVKADHRRLMTVLQRSQPIQAGDR